MPCDYFRTSRTRRALCFVFILATFALNGCLAAGPRESDRESGTPIAVELTLAAGHAYRLTSDSWGPSCRAIVNQTNMEVGPGELIHWIFRESPANGDISNEHIGLLMLTDASGLSIRLEADEMGVPDEGTWNGGYSITLSYASMDNQSLIYLLGPGPDSTASLTAPASCSVSAVSLGAYTTWNETNFASTAGAAVPYVLAEAGAHEGNISIDSTCPAILRMFRAAVARSGGLSVGELSYSGSSSASLNFVEPFEVGQIPIPRGAGILSLREAHWQTNYVFIAAMWARDGCT